MQNQSCFLLGHIFGRPYITSLYQFVPFKCAAKNIWLMSVQNTIAFNSPMQVKDEVKLCQVDVHMAYNSSKQERLTEGKGVAGAIYP